MNKELKMNIVEYNKEAWENWVEKNCVYTVPIDHESIEKARNNDLQIQLTPKIIVPKDWFGNIINKEILCLASGGGQQGPMLAAAGANVTVFDNSPSQLEKDKYVARRENLNMKYVQGDMKDLSLFKDNAFDIVFHPVSNCFVENIEIVWKECFRVLKNNGRLLSGFVNPIVYIFDFNKYDREKTVEVRYKIPYSDIEQLPKDELDKKIKSKDPLEYGHSLDSQIGGQIKAGFTIKGYYEEKNEKDDIIDKNISTYISTLAIKE
jgi:SAM-dependent methyltransferase